MARERKAGRTDAQAGKAGSRTKTDPRAKRTFRLDAGVARRYEAHCVLRGIDKDKHLEEILANYLGGSYWVDKTRDAPPAAGTSGQTTHTQTGADQERAGKAD